MIYHPSKPTISGSHDPRFFHQATALAEGVRALRLGRTAWDDEAMVMGQDVFGVERTWENRRKMVVLWVFKGFYGIFWDIPSRNLL